MDFMLPFDKLPELFPLVAELHERLLNDFAGVSFRVGKTQISYTNRFGFAWVWPPFRRKKDWPSSFVGVSFGLDHKLCHPRIVAVANPYPRRFTHHVLVTSFDELDDELFGWIRLSYDFSQQK